MDEKVAEFVNEHFIATYLKVGTFQIVNGQKQGGNVVSYFCLGDGAVLHAVPGSVNARTFLSEARRASEAGPRRQCVPRRSLGTRHEGRGEGSHAERGTAECFISSTAAIRSSGRKPRRLPTGTGSCPWCGWRSCRR